MEGVDDDEAFVRAADSNDDDDEDDRSVAVLENFSRFFPITRTKAQLVRVLILLAYNL